LRMGRVHARGDEMTILVPHHLYDVVSRQGSASVVLDEFEWRGDQFRVDYESYEIRAWNSRLKLELGARVAARESSIGLPDRDR
jgi:hypothetical protein